MSVASEVVAQRVAKEAAGLILDPSQWNGTGDGKSELRLQGDKKELADVVLTALASLRDSLHTAININQTPSFEFDPPNHEFVPGDSAHTIRVDNRLLEAYRQIVFAMPTNALGVAHELRFGVTKTPSAA